MERRPLVFLDDATLSELPAGDTLPVMGEPALGNPASDGQVLASTAAGVRSWVDSASGGGSTTPNLITTTYSVPADTSIMVVDTLEITATGALDNSGNVGVW